VRVAEIRTSAGRIRYVVVNKAGELVEPVVRFLKHLDDLGYARNTLRAYGHSLALFFRYLGQHGLAYDAVGVQELGTFVHWLKLPGSPRESVATRMRTARADRTINAHLVAVMGFYDYLWRTEALNRNLNERLRGSGRNRPFKRFLQHLGPRLSDGNVLRQREPRRAAPVTLDQDQVNALAAACRTTRDRLVVQLLFETGLRPGEVLALWLEDVQIRPPQIRVVDRGELPNLAEIKRPASERCLDVTADLINRILAYVTVAHSEDVLTNHVFLKEHGPKRGQPMDYADLRGVFQRLGRRSGIAATPYRLRHTSLTNLARAGWAPEHLQVRAGHAHFQTTYSTYVHPRPEDLRAAWQRTHGAITDTAT
jgi:integrase/recombinase XerD